VTQVFAIRITIEGSMGQNHKMFGTIIILFSLKDFKYISEIYLIVYKDLFLLITRKNILSQFLKLCIQNQS